MPYCAYCGSWTEQVSAAPCASCGKPANGAPVRAVASSGSNPALIVVGVIVAALVGVAILGILAAIAIPNFITATERAKQKRTMADIRSVATAAEAYATENRTYPRAASMDELVPILTPKFMMTVPRVDGWGNEIRYRCLDDACEGYEVSSSGKDRLFEHVRGDEYSTLQTSSFDCDIVYVNGNFVQYPEGRSN
jgi:type II secretory pathway pseudopilin PulG